MKLWPVAHFFTHFWNQGCTRNDMLQCFVCSLIPKVREKKGATGQSFIRKEITSYRIGTLVIMYLLSTHCLLNIAVCHFFTVVQEMTCCNVLYVPRFQKWVKKKGATGQSFIWKEITSYRIGTLGIIFTNQTMYLRDTQSSNIGRIDFIMRQKLNNFSTPCWGPHESQWKYHFKKHTIITDSIEKT